MSSEVALALILLTGAGLLLQSFSRLSRVNTGLQTERLFTAFVVLPQVSLSVAGKRLEFSGATALPAADSPRRAICQYDHSVALERK